MKRQSGFTLIELMIVVAIVAILAAIALPAYQTYTKKSKMTQLVAATGSLKTAVEVCMQTYGPGQCALGDHGMPASSGSYAGVDLTYTAPASGADTTITATVSASGASSTLAPLTTSNTVTMTAPSEIPMVWTISCDTDATNDGYCPN
ncbi:prepilin-type N-terminal cleavage/methylation domain-containing protein [Aeromonas caviae]|uniref:pilin n=1 Tax=Aeromonas caviae TaxID=648 RepID=UPI00191F8409|nr:prepilin-type N-terminal cleavage/methylation domain-containing protein [Aeromonas caviae]MBL0448945.1 prepilin-type N-terminal cleavage/methylation domain-containing protein [Aeromonas caviae]